MRARQFEVVVKGTLGAPLVATIQDAQGFVLTATEGGESHFVGYVPDQARLWGLLSALQRLGIELVSVNPFPRTTFPSPADTNEGSNHA